MRYLALVTDHDGTLAVDGAMSAEAVAALERLRRSGRRAILVTGRRLPDLMAVCPRLDLFPRGVLYRRTHPAPSSSAPPGPRYVVVDNVASLARTPRRLRRSRPMRD
jgi:hypothetical protein